MRIAAIPCQVVPPSQHVPSRLDARDHVAGERVDGGSSASPSPGGVEADEDLVEHDVVEDRDARAAGEPLGEPPGVARSSDR